jgi:hypothetical protein
MYYNHGRQTHQHIHIVYDRFPMATIEDLDYGAPLLSDIREGQDMFEPLRDA